MENVSLQVVVAMMEPLQEGGQVASSAVKVVEAALLEAQDIVQDHLRGVPPLPLEIDALGGSCCNAGTLLDIWSVSKMRCICQWRIPKMGAGLRRCCAAASERIALGRLAQPCALQVRCMPCSAWCGASQPPRSLSSCC